MTPEKWLVLSVSVPSAVETGLVAEGLLRLGGSGVEEKEGMLITYLPPQPDLEIFGREARERLETSTGLRGLQIRLGWQDQEAWEETWKRGLKPRRVSDRLVVTPTWIRPDTGSGDVLIRIDPGMAFGTAEHASTRGCLRLLEPVVEDGSRIADIGAGSGILSIAAAKLGAALVLAVEVDPYACRVAEENIAANGVACVVRVIERAATCEYLADLGGLDGFVANIESGAIIRLLRGFRDGLRQGGWLVIGGIGSKQAGATCACAARAGFELVERVRDEGWWSGRFRRTSGPLVGEQSLS
jgi:ribosomal protein L11 methyltransferase